MLWRMVNRHYQSGTQRLLLETSRPAECKHDRKVAEGDVECIDQHPHPRRWRLAGPVTLRDGSVDPSPRLAQ